MQWSKRPSLTGELGDDDEPLSGPKKAAQKGNHFLSKKSINKPLTPHAEKFAEREVRRKKLESLIPKFKKDPNLVMRLKYRDLLIMPGLLGYPVIVLHGTPKIGKSSFSAKAPHPVFADIERGTKHLNVARLPFIEKFSDLLSHLKFVRNGRLFEARGHAMSGLETDRERFSTFIRVAKFRVDGSVTRYISKCIFNIETNRYEDDFILGTTSEDGRGFTPLEGRHLYPSWALSGGGHMKSHYHHIFIDARSVMVPVFYSNQERFSSVKALFSLIASIMKEFHPQTICVVFGDHLSKSKKEFYPKYGSTRNERRDEKEKKALANEIEIATYFLSHCPVRSISPIGIEAKDAIGYLSKILQKPKLIVSSNKDYFQILRPDLQVMEPKDGLMISETEAELILGFPIKYYLLWKSIVGDSQNGTHGITRCK